MGNRTMGGMQNVIRKFHISTVNIEFSKGGHMLRFSCLNWLLLGLISGESGNLDIISILNCLLF